jgi:hypothetical protein
MGSSLAPAVRKGSVPRDSKVCSPTVRRTNTGTGGRRTEVEQFARKSNQIYCISYQIARMPNILVPKQIKIAESERLQEAVEDLIDIVEAVEQEPAAPQMPYIELSAETASRIGVRRIVRRECYDHILPIIKHSMKRMENSCVTGTPGIGKTLFGLFLLRSLIQDESTVAYWNDSYAILFSMDAAKIEQYSLEQTYDINGKSWHVGCWMHDEPFLNELLSSKHVSVVHDPQEGFVTAGTDQYAKGTAIILSFGHKLISKWASKRTGFPPVFLSMPFFDYEEIVENKSNLFHGTQLTSDQVGEKYRRFGGSIRHYVAGTEALAWNELKAKVLDVAATGKGLGVRTSTHKGSIVHVWVDFDKSKPMFPAVGYNEFSKRDYILGSEELTVEYYRALASVGRDHLSTIMNVVNGQEGAEAVYGALFEKYAHDMLQHDNRELKIRVVRRDGKQKAVYASTTLPVEENKVHIFTGREANGIKDHLLPGEKLGTGTYILPEISNFPTYDSAVVIPATNVGLQGNNVGLLFQMTVSGASGLRRHPKHTVKHYMRKDMDKVLRETTEDAIALSVTTFCVPTACFHPFDYQPELCKDSNDQVTQQAEYQFVIEIPGFTPLPDTSTKPAGIHGKTGRAHNYTLREPNKKARIEDLL